MRLLNICWLIDTQWHWGGMSSHSYMNWLDDDWKRFTVKYFLTNNSCTRNSLIIIYYGYYGKLWISIKPFLSFFDLKNLKKIERMKCFKTNCTFLKFIFGDTLYTLSWIVLRATSKSLAKFNIYWLTGPSSLRNADQFWSINSTAVEMPVSRAKNRLSCLCNVPVWQTWHFYLSQSLLAK